MNDNKAKFDSAYGISSQLPKSEITEIAFAGRANVGKSSLLNKLFNRKDLARVSSVPGKTITINFYDVDGVNFVDLPGYGFAKRSKTERQKLEQMISGYILQRECLTNLFVLIDCRHEPQQIDLEFMQWLGESGVPFSIVFTKADKLSKQALSNNINAYLTRLAEEWEPLPPHFITSAETRQGRDELLNYIEEINKDINKI